MQKTSKNVKLIGVSPQAYEELKNMGHVTDSFASVVDKLLAKSSRTPGDK